jgi:hypothetical protein
VRAAAIEHRGRFMERVRGLSSQVREEFREGGSGEVSPYPLPFRCNWCKGDRGVMG